MISFSDYKQKVQGVKRKKKPSLLRTGYMIHRNVSAPISYFCVTRFPKLTPNMVSLSMIILGLLGSYLLFLNETVFTFVGLSLIYLSFILDKVDGEIARFLDLNSIRGVYLDETYHFLIGVTTLASYVIPRIDTLTTIFIMMVIVSTFLMVYRRVERKLCFVICVKKYEALKNRTIKLSSPALRVQSFFNSFFWRLTTVVERFDLLLLVLLVLALSQEFAGVNYTDLFLIVYTIVSLLYSVRWFFINLFGGIDDLVKQFQID